LDIESLLKARGARDIHEQVHCVLEVLNKAKQVGPLARLLIELIQSLSYSEARVIAAVYQGVTAVGERISSEVCEELHLIFERLPSLQREGLSIRPGLLSFPRPAPEYPAREKPISGLDFWSRKPGGKLDA
jgi:hypothetical protein